MYTPGPWIGSEGLNESTIGARGTPYLARVYLKWVSINEYKANVRLIKAAPELLAALRTMLAADAAFRAGETFPFSDAVLGAKSVIAEVEGKE